MGNKQNIERSSLNGAKIEELALKYGLSKRFVREAIEGVKDSPTAKTVKKEYQELTKKASELFPLVSKAH